MGRTSSYERLKRARERERERDGATAAAPGEAAAPSPRLPSLASLRDAHARLMARRDEVDAAFQSIDAAAAAIPVPRPGQRVPADLAYHPKGLPPAGALPSLTQMADPECKTNIGREGGGRKTRAGNNESALSGTARAWKPRGFASRFSCSSFVREPCAHISHLRYLLFSMSMTHSVHSI